MPRQRTALRVREEENSTAVADQPLKYVWCLCCARTYVRGQYRREGNEQLCPYEGCDGDALADAWRWSAVRRNNPDYPSHPVRGVVYRLS